MLGTRGKQFADGIGYARQYGKVIYCVMLLLVVAMRFEYTHQIRKWFALVARPQTVSFSSKALLAANGKPEVQTHLCIVQSLTRGGSAGVIARMVLLRLWKKVLVLDCDFSPALRYS